MKKLILMSCLIVSFASFAGINDLPDNVERNIRSAVSSYSGSERRENYDWYKDSYLEMINRLDSSGIPEVDKQTIIKRLEAMYGGNYPKQLSRVNDEINDYKGLVNRIREEQSAVQQKTEAENQKSKEEIKSILSSSPIPKADLDKIEQNAKAEYPNDYTLQKAYIKGAIKTYNDLKK
ncbi:hypothetical protein KST04_05705 [Fusobacterium vincentii]|uniref:hypothetical protein n=1 Tax=Fusobacterium vincentii TaxID=155615 RepID=UPI001C6F2D02|nr:hypothetical protein [Fusobacterium vincentii]QYR57057.1 hypothetical protein JY399_00215 [Fusobacterium vincentii]